MTKKRKRLLGFLALLVVAAVVTGFLLSNRPQKIVVQTGPVERVAKLDSVVSASGEIRAKEFVDLQTEIAGVIVELPVKEGERVEQGQVLLRIDPFQARQDVASAQAQYDGAVADESSALVQVSMGESAAARDEYAVTASQSDLVQAESNRDHLKAQLDRRKLLNEQKLISADEYEAAESSLRTAESQVLSAKARVDQSRAGHDMTRVTIDQWKRQHEGASQRKAVAKANLERMADLLAKTTITSPLGGVITKLNVSKGERAVPGILSNPQATLMTIADLSTIEAEMKVDETDIINVSIDDHATVTVDALPDTELQGHVTEMGNSPIGDTGELTAVSSSNQQGKDFKVVVRIEDPPASLRPGLSASAEILVDHRENALVIPLQAVTVREVEVDAAGTYVPKEAPELQPKPDESAEGKPALASSKDGPELKELEGVFVRDGERARFRPVKLGIKGDSDVEVLDGLKDGDEIITGSYRILRTLKDWDFVEVKNSELPAVARPKGRARK